jgi:hypothetical protein
MISSEFQRPAQLVSNSKVCDVTTQSLHCAKLSIYLPYPLSCAREQEQKSQAFREINEVRNERLSALRPRAQQDKRGESSLMQGGLQNTSISMIQTH